MFCRYFALMVKIFQNLKIFQWFFDRNNFERFWTPLYILPCSRSRLNIKERTFLWKGNFHFDHCIEPEFSVERIQNRWLNRLLCLIVNYWVWNFDVLWNCKNPATCNNDRNKNCYHLSQMCPGNLEYSHFHTTEICFIETQTNKITFLQIQSFSTIR